MIQERHFSTVIRTHRREERILACWDQNTGSSNGMAKERERSDKSCDLSQLEGFVRRGIAPGYCRREPPRTTWGGKLESHRRTILKLQSELGMLLKDSSPPLLTGTSVLVPHSVWAPALGRDLKRRHESDRKQFELG